MVMMLPHRLIEQGSKDAFTGPGVISGTVAIDDSPDIPVQRRVRLFDRLTGRFVREAWSDAATGAYTFTRLEIRAYFVVAFDHTGTHNAVIKDSIFPEVV